MAISFKNASMVNVAVKNYWKENRERKKERHEELSQPEHDHVQYNIKTLSNLLKMPSEI